MKSGAVPGAPRLGSTKWRVWPYRPKAWLGTAPGRAPGSVGKALWGACREEAVGGARLGVLQRSGERDGNGVPAG